ncbi:MAG: 4-hydroxythreonine-4-phosphate dehydrogenase PdxA [Candidatus Omnitrophica bacterium]|jgi:4-hydroxythreonine-4-phosphate dehydrogenase|nr:4-hydroxythreonine-4-phosphate dehydrogenase PdxA [Candidatus Omnitrophota bacterium]MDD5078886.1 4-hydroxythreonine-4-phosphate dehydrogenase PdxA [Candidatus Omnitrophota bacterium]
MALRSSRISIGITIGDPAGIGPEVVAKALGYRYNAKITVIGDKRVFDKYGRKAKGFEFIDLNNVKRGGFKPGQVKPAYGRASMEYLDLAMDLLKFGSIHSLVTAPISKEAINLAGYHYSGHTEYLEKQSRVPHSVMMLLNDKFRFSLVTRHIPLKDAASRISAKSIEETIAITYNSLKNIFGVSYPRIVVCGINPHASDNGLIGDEENRIIIPCLKRLSKKIKGIAGPLPADIAIARAAKGKFDAVIAMFHDQALIPLKLTGDQSGVNITLGLNFIRTSPLHGTAFDIAGKGKADPGSMISAIKLALECTANQKKA